MYEPLNHNLYLFNSRYNCIFQANRDKLLRLPLKSTNLSIGMKKKRTYTFTVN